MRVYYIGENSEINNIELEDHTRTFNICEKSPAYMGGYTVENIELRLYDFRYKGRKDIKVAAQRYSEALLIANLVYGDKIKVNK